MRDLGKYKGEMKEEKDYMGKGVYEGKVKGLEGLMDDLEEGIEGIREEMDEVIGWCGVLFRERELLMWIEGVGGVVGRKMIMSREGFRGFDDWRKFKCYGGVGGLCYCWGSWEEWKGKV